MNTNKTLLLNTDPYNVVKGYSKSDNYQDGFNNIRNEYGISGEEVIDMVFDWIENKANNLLDQCKKVQNVVIVGRFGWLCNDIECVREDNLEKAILRCAKDMHNVKVYNDNGVIEVVAYHLYGYKSFYIYQLNQRGINASKRADLSKKSYHKKINL